MGLISILNEKKQSLWLDNIVRDMFSNGYLVHMKEKYGISGLTSNPTIFANSLKTSYLYDNDATMLLRKGFSAEEIIQSLMIEDIQMACDFFRNTWEESNGKDGYVSMEVSPLISFDSEAIKREARLLNEKIGRKNLLIKIPATDSGISAGETLLTEGININFTLIFSAQVYEKVAMAFINAIQKRKENKIESYPFSVASFFVSRIDAVVDSMLDSMLLQEKDSDKKTLIESLKGKAAVANSLLAYEKYMDFFLSEKYLKSEGSHIPLQKLLWASTGVKKTEYKKSMYISLLALPGTINTALQDAIIDFDDSGRFEEENIYERIAKAKEIIKTLGELGIDFQSLLKDLMKDGIEKFIYSYNSLIELANEKKYALKEGKAIKGETMETSILKVKNFARRLKEKDPSLWKSDKENSNQIKNSLGWVDIPYKMLHKVDEIKKFTESVKKEGFSDVVLLGMGGSSLAPQVYRSIFQKSGYPKLYVLDTTNPSAILTTLEKIDLKKTLFIFSSKSGGTIEPNSQFAYFFDKLKKAKIPEPGSRFIAITDKGTGLEKLAQSKKFRKVFINPSDIGGRFSALSYFGLVPASLCGADISKLLEKACQTADASLKDDSDSNLGLSLGSFMGENFLKGRDKLTLIISKKLKTFGLWIEQLVAESTGKDGKGIIPICEDSIMDASFYQDDRAFVTVEFENFSTEDYENSMEELKKAGYPVMRFFIKDPYELASQFYIWETATAAAGSIMQINPFNQPDVQLSKSLTIDTIKNFVRTRKLENEKPIFDSPNVSLYISPALKNSVNNKIKNYEDIFWEIFSALREKEYFATLAYLEQSPLSDNLLSNLIYEIKKATASACFYSYGPRYLHSTGQLFKGGKDNGVFLILTYKPKKDINIPGEKYTFWQLHMAQAIGDFQALKEKGRRVIRIHLKKDLEKALKKLTERISRLNNEAVVKSEDEMVKLVLKKKPAYKNNENKTHDYVVIDYPKNLETITSNNYTVRIGASNCLNVEISIDDQPWQNCRHSVGYWWYDWHNIQPGNHQITARMNLGNGNYLISKRRRCKVTY